MPEKWRNIKCPQCGKASWGIAFKDPALGIMVECMPCGKQEPILYLEFLYVKEYDTEYTKRLANYFKEHAVARMRISERARQSYKEISVQLEDQSKLTYNLWRAARGI